MRITQAGGVSILQRDFILGEKKYIKLKATSCDGSPVVITGAAYELFEGEALVEEGSCSVNGDEFMVLLEPPKTGDFVLVITYEVAPETRKVKVAINVA